MKKAKHSQKNLAVIFDVDGTLIDSVDLHARAWQEALAAFGHYPSFRRVRSQIGKGGDQLLPVFLTKQEIQSSGRALQNYRGTLFTTKYLPRVRAFPKVRELFLRLRKDHWKIAIASSAKKKDLRIYQRLCGIARLVDVVTSADDVIRSKPKPDILEVARRRLNRIDPKRCVMVGDSPFDAIAARKAKMRAIGFLSGGFGRSRLKTAGCTSLYRDPEDLLMRYENSAFRRLLEPSRASRK